MTELYDKWLIERTGQMDLRSSYVGELQPPIAVRINSDGSEYRRTRLAHAAGDIVVVGPACPVSRERSSSIRRVVLCAIDTMCMRKKSSARVLPITLERRTLLGPRE